MKDVFIRISQFISAVSIVLNLYLLYVYLRCPLKMIQSYKYFFLLAALQDIILSICILLTVPTLISENFSTIFIGIGPLRVQSGGQVLIVIFALIFMTSLLLVANSFIYRYLKVCKPHFFKTSLNPRVLLVAVLFNGAATGNWCIMIAVSVWPSEEFIGGLSGMVARMTGLNSSECAQLGFSMKFGVTPVTLTILTEGGVSVLLTAIVIAYSAVKISRTLKKSAFSKNLRKLHQQMFVLLLLQTACPFALLQVPLFSAYIQLFTGFSSNTAISYTITILLSLFPVLSPIIIVFFLRDYRSYTLSAIRKCAGRKAVQSVLVSKMKTNQATAQPAQ